MIRPTYFFKFLILIAVLFSACTDTQEESIPTRPDAEFRRYIAGFTSGVIFRDSEISILLLEPSPEFTVAGDELDAAILDISPKLAGKLIWKDDKTIQFIPSEKMKSGTRYEFVFHLGEVIDVENHLQEFPFSIYTKEQGMKVEVINVSPYEDTQLQWNQVKGWVVTADYMESELVEQGLEVEIAGKEYPVSWLHESDGRAHRFYVDSVERKLDAQKLEVHYDMSQGDFESDGTVEFEIPSINNFSYRTASIARDPEQHIRIEFTDPVDASQAMKGLVRLKDYDDFRFEFESNVLKAYPSERKSGPQILQISKDVQNSLGYTLQEAIEVEMDFTELKPHIRSAFNGTILPSTDGKVFPFEAVNLRAVDVDIKRIYENNIPQFLQVNELSSSYQLARVGKTVLKKRIDLSSQKALDYGQWNVFTLDLDELIRQEPGAIYQVNLSFRPSYSIYPCEVAVEEDGLEDVTYHSEDEYYDWEYYDSYYYYVPGYDWEERENPCHISYYVNRTVSHNILATDIGLIAKRGKDDQTYIAVNDIKTAQPIRGVDLELYDEQNQLIGSGKSKGDGTASIQTEIEPALLIAKRGEEKAYLKLRDGSALSMSHFDVNGRVLQDGMKGFIYGERGVWRPGDTLFLDFILEDVAGKLPEGHPVILELTDPRGHRAHREVRKMGLNGIYDFQVVTAADAPTGMWSAKVKVGAAEFYKSLPIEAVKPNRLKMELDFGEVIEESAGQSVGTLNATWLHGAIAKNLKAEVAMTLNKSHTRPEGFEDYQFLDPARDLDPQEKILFQGRLDETGTVRFPMDVQMRDVAPGLLKAYFTTKVFEEGGGHSIDRFSIPYSPFDRYIGVKMPRNSSMEAGSEHTIQVAAVDYAGNPVRVEGLQVDVYMLRWRWWWDSGAERLAQYTADQGRHRVQSYTVDAFTGKSEFTLKVPEHEWSRYMIRISDKSGGHSTGAMFYGYVPWRPGQDRGDMPGGATMLSFQLDKERYKVGETAQIEIPTGGTGRALISIEDGMQVIQQEWVDVDSELLRYRFEVNPEMAPNAYVHATLIQPHERDNELPIRMYGIAPLTADDESTILHPQIDMPDKLQPEQTVRIKVSEENDRPMTYTLALVDEGLLDLTGFKTPDPHAAFYAREALGVKTWDRYDDVIGAFGAMIQQTLSVGGGEEVDAEQEQKVNRFKPMVRHIGPFTLKKGKSNTHELTLPNYIGSVRVMVVAAQDASYGQTEKTVKVNKPLMVLATLPRVLGPEEDVRLPVSVFAMEDKIKQVEVSVELTGPVTLQGESKRTIRFTQPEEQMLFFDLKTGTTEGKATARVTVNGGGHTAHYDIELPVRQSRLPETRSEIILLEAGDSKSIDFSHFAMPGTEELSVELSSMPAINLESRLGYLTRYPYGCAEQTISGAFPQLYLKSFLGEEEELALKSTTNIVDVLSYLGKFQRSDGSFSTWPDRSYYSDWTTSYAGHFMIEAKRMGYAVPEAIYDKWLAYQQKDVKGEYRSSAYYAREWHEKARAYRLYTLALAGKPDIASMNRLKNSQLLDKPSIYMLAAAYHLAGQTDIARRLVDDHPHFTPKNRRDGYSYGSFSRDQAILLECLVQMDRKVEALPIIMQIAEALGSERYMNTQTTAWCLRAMLSLDILEKKDMDYQLSLDGQEISSGRSQLTFKRFDLEQAGRTGQVSVSNRSEGPLYARVIQTGIPSRATVKAEQSNVQLDVRYLDMQGNPIAIDRIEQGTEFYVDLTVSNPNTEDPLENLALTVVLPSGWEPNIDRMDAPQQEEPTDTPDYMDIRDDQVLLFFSLDRFEENRRYNWRRWKKHFRFTVNASYSGEYYMPGPQVESMYDQDVYDRKAGKKVNVYRAGME